MEDHCIANMIKQQKHKWLGHILCYDERHTGGQNVWKTYQRKKETTTQSWTQLHIATYWIFTIQKLLCKQMFVCNDLITVCLSTYCREPYELFRVFYAFCIMYIVHLCAIDLRLINATCLLVQLMSNIYERTSYESVKKRAEDRCLWRVLEMEVNELL